MKTPEEEKQLADGVRAAVHQLNGAIEAACSGGLVVELKVLHYEEVGRRGRKPVVNPEIVRFV